MRESLQRKIVSLEDACRVTRAARAAGKTVVQCHGCFDIVHPGHIRYLEFARKQGDILIVSVTGDSDISKGDNRPLIPQELRTENLAALMFVDYVCVSTEPTAEQILAALQPDIYVKGREYENSKDEGFLAEKSSVEGYGGRIVYSSGEIVFSSTQLIKHVAPGADSKSQRLNFVCQRHGINAAKFNKMIDRIQDMNVLIVGDVVIDRYVLCDALGVASEAPIMSLAHRDDCCYVGGAAIIARHVAAMGARGVSAFDRQLLRACGDDRICAG